MKEFRHLMQSVTGSIGSADGLSGLKRVNQKLLKRGIKYDSLKGYTLDIDATGIEAEKQSAKMTYKGFKGYMPIVGHLAENGLILGDKFREGNVAPAARNLEFLKYCIKQMLKGKKIKAFRAVVRAKASSMLYPFFLLHSD